VSQEGSPSLEEDRQGGTRCRGVGAASARLGFGAKPQWGAGNGVWSPEQVSARPLRPERARQWRADCVVASSRAAGPEARVVRCGSV